MTDLTLDGASFSKFAMLYLDETGRFIDVGDPDRDEARPVEADGAGEVSEARYRFAKRRHRCFCLGARLAE